MFMTEIERDQILLNLDKKVNQINSIIVPMQEKVSQIDSIIVPMQEKVSQIDIMQKDIKELKEETRRISKSVAFIEHDHGKKIDTLIDIMLGNLEEQNSIKKKLNSHNSILDNHSDRIWNLESKLGII